MVLFVPRKIATVTQANPNRNEKFHELPKPSGKSPYHLALNSVIPDIQNIGEIEFHIVGDTGETKTPQAQHMVEMAMEADFDKHPISFLYHVGDVVYKFGKLVSIILSFTNLMRTTRHQYLQSQATRMAMYVLNSNEKSLASLCQ